MYETWSSAATVMISKNKSALVFNTNFNYPCDLNIEQMIENANIVSVLQGNFITTKVSVYFRWATSTVSKCLRS